MIFSVKAAELIVPIPELDDGSPDWRVVQQVGFFPSTTFSQPLLQVWWDMEDVVARFESEDKYPVDLAVEDRSFPKGATPSNYYTRNQGKRECEFARM